MSEPQMISVRVLPGSRLPMPDGGYLTKGECLVMDCAAKLVQGSMVAVFLGGKFATVGRIVRRPVPSLHLVIEYRDVNGDKHIERTWGLKDKDVQIWRVIGVHTPAPAFGCPEGSGSVRRQTMLADDQATAYARQHD